MSRVTIATTADRDEAQVLVSMLRSAGIDAELIGVVDAARIGVGDNALPLRVEVEQEDEAEARELMAAPRFPAPQEDEGPPPLSRKRPIIALGVPLVWPGLAHIYATRPFTGGALAIGALISLFGHKLTAALPLLMILDAFFGRRAVLAFNRGEHRGVGLQLVAGVAMALGALLVVGGPDLVASIQRDRERAELAHIAFMCTRDSLELRNVGAEPRDLEVLALEETQPPILFAYGEAEPLRQFPVPSRRVIAAGEGIRISVPPRAFIDPTRPNFVFRAKFVLRRHDGQGASGTLSCDPTRP